MKLHPLLTATITASALTLSMSALAQSVPTQQVTQATQSTAAASTFSPAQQDEIASIVKSTIINNPQILVEASQSLQRQELSKQEKSAISAIAKNKQQIFSDPMTPIAGNPKGSISVVEFYDFQCGHCKAMEPVIAKFIQANKNVKFIFKDLPIFGGASNQAAQASVAAYKLDKTKWFTLHNLLLGDETPLNSAEIQKYAGVAGYNVQALKKAASGQDVLDNIKSNLQLATALNLMGTPSFVIGKADGSGPYQFIPGATDAKGLQAAVDAVNK